MNNDNTDSNDSNDSQDLNNRRRIIKPSRGSVSSVIVVPSVEALTSDAKAIIGKQMTLLRHKSDKGLTLDLKEARMLTSYLDSLVRLLREERESAKHEDLSKYTVEELFEALKIDKAK